MLDDRMKKEKEFTKQLEESIATGTKYQVKSDTPSEGKTNFLQFALGKVRSTFEAENVKNRTNYSLLITSRSEEIGQAIDDHKRRVRSDHVSSDDPAPGNLRNARSVDQYQEDKIVTTLRSKYFKELQRVAGRYRMESTTRSRVSRSVQLEDSADTYSKILQTEPVYHQESAPRSRKSPSVSATTQTFKQSQLKVLISKRIMLREDPKQSVQGVSSKRTIGQQGPPTLSRWQGNREAQRAYSQRKIEEPPVLPRLTKPSSTADVFRGLSQRAGLTVTRIQVPHAQKEGDRTEQDVSIDYKNGDNFAGNLANGLRTGEGAYTFKNGDMYAGEFQDGNFFGKGTYTTEGGDIYEGTFLNNSLHGQGTATYMSIPAFQTYVGFWQNNYAHGKGKLTLDMGDYYEGSFENGRYHGRGVMYYTNGDAYDGNYVNGHPQGDGEFIFKDTNVIMRRKFAANGVDRANTSDLRANTFDIKKQNNVRVKEFKQVANQKVAPRNPGKKVDNSGLIHLLAGLKSKPAKGKGAVKASRSSSKAQPAKKKASGVTKKIQKKVPTKAPARAIAPTGKKAQVKKAKRVKSSVPTVWSDYAYKYPNAQQKAPVETSKIIAEIDDFKPEVRRSKSILFCLESARAYFEQRQRIRNSSGNPN